MHTHVGWLARQVPAVRHERDFATHANRWQSRQAHGSCRPIVVVYFPDAVGKEISTLAADLAPQLQSPGMKCCHCTICHRGRTKILERRSDMVWAYAQPPICRVGRRSVLFLGLVFSRPLCCCTRRHCPQCTSSLYAYARKPSCGEEPCTSPVAFEPRAGIPESNWAPTPSYYRWPLFRCASARR